MLVCSAPRRSIDRPIVSYLCVTLCAIPVANSRMHAIDFTVSKTQNTHTANFTVLCSGSSCCCSTLNPTLHRRLYFVTEHAPRTSMLSHLVVAGQVVTRHQTPVRPSRQHGVNLPCTVLGACPTSSCSSHVCVQQTTAAVNDTRGATNGIRHTKPQAAPLTCAVSHRRLMALRSAAERFSNSDCMTMNMPGGSEALVRRRSSWCTGGTASSFVRAHTALAMNLWQSHTHT